MKLSLTTGGDALALALAGCTDPTPGDPQASGPITTTPIVTTQKVPAGRTPTGATGYALANSARTNGTIITGTAAPCGPESAGGRYEIACSEAAGLPGTASPYRR
ncbi:hypothetical protein H9N28_03810 [Rhodobacter capsulatus]|uniref:hypothetical protein n=1 Tax=Rhodobacter capsulatus TaxID=1061 RepID=UPI0006DC9D3D|nr:hypothetical protein [Rhodobacter capsulatus]KQB15219.1 hypothetical protein AP073_14185 [Rhodobacter capsulatus]KQB16025.1 hypothetical protein AP071_12685 [Rhodobacter capsulatus]PZX25669.1 hypothetical protein LY44_01452 [Rhodobacter capsulatus]QNR63975.1 hypothetical protein H9N28_03810 [Rhodobacter capsulatus]